MRSLFAIILAFIVVPSATMADGLPDFTPIVERNSPAVVKILSVQVSESKPNLPGVDPRYYEQLPEIFKHFLDRGQPRSPNRRSMGSGFIISEDGYILTNNHVIDGADKVTVRLIDRREYLAEIVGSDERSDLALLKVDESGLPTVDLGDDADLKVGEWVLAIGSPFGLDYSVTAGIVSAMGRSIPNESNENYVPFIQTDVAINPGNSGGPLFNLDGEVVGINSQIYTRSGGSIGLSFAIPVTVARDVVDQLKDKGSVSRGWLGVGIQEVDKNLADSFGLDKPMGSLVSQIEPGGPAEESGILVGDIIIEFDGQPINLSADLPHVVGMTRPGSTVPVKVMRDGKVVKLKVKVGTLDDKGAEALIADVPESAGGRLGLKVENVPESYRKRWNLRGGVLIREVVSGMPGADFGLRKGDVITQIGNALIGDAEDFHSIVEGLPTNVHIAVRIVRRGRPGFVAIRLEDE